MEDIKSTTVVPIAWYCFIVGGALELLAIKGFYSNKSMFSSGDIIQWLPWVTSALLGGTMISVGRGILKASQKSWKVLFFSLAICVSSVASFTIASVIFYLIDAKFLDPCFQNFKANTFNWLSFFAIFLSEIIVLYYLTKEEVVSCFGDMGPMISPF